MRLVPCIVILLFALAAPAAAQAEAVALSDGALAEMRARSDAKQQAIINFPGPGVTLESVSIEPSHAVINDRFTAEMRFSKILDFCGAGNCNQTAFSLSVRTAISHFSTR
jgi:hypothetical protein